MGGTTAKASLVRDGHPAIAEGYYVGGYASGHPVMLPVVDIVEVGAGGGSIGWIDSVGALKVGPRSAGASPGPVCYRTGGEEPTITDANLVLGRINGANFLGGEMALDEAAARAALEGKARRQARPHRRGGGARHAQDRGRAHDAGGARRLDRARLRSARFRHGRVGRQRRVARAV